MITINQHADGVSFAVRVHPRARQEGIAGAIGDALKLNLNAPPVEGRANEACLRFFAQLLNVPRASVTIVSGATSRTKTIKIVGVSAEELRAVIQSQG